MDVKTSTARLKNGEIDNNLGDQNVSEAVIVISVIQEEKDNTNASKDSNKASTVNWSSEESIEERKKKDLECDNSYCIIDLKGKICENSETEVVCRICHLSSDPSSDLPNNSIAIHTRTLNLVRLGCACKGELGNVHPYCVDAWFKLKGNRKCEICGEIAKNVKGIENTNSGEEWNEVTTTANATSLSETANAYWRGQTFCNLLMACLVTAFVLPWFFRVKLF